MTEYSVAQAMSGHEEIRTTTQTTAEREQFKKAMSHFATGIAIVTGRYGDQIHGMTCNAFCSISLSPMLVLVSLSEHTRTEKLVQAGRIFAVNILSEQQFYVSDRFTGRHPACEQNRFEGIEWTSAVTEAPILRNSMAYVDCAVSDTFRQGGHALILGNVLAAHYDERLLPLVFFQSHYVTIDRSRSG
jgi:flavin reductase (DIM6/NTAB) family NADH-FMN oxidoreductase RutF